MANRKARASKSTRTRSGRVVKAPVRYPLSTPAATKKRAIRKKAAIEEPSTKKKELIGDFDEFEAIYLAKIPKSKKADATTRAALKARRDAALEEMMAIQRPRTVSEIYEGPYVEAKAAWAKAEGLGHLDEVDVAWWKLLRQGM